MLHRTYQRRERPPPVSGRRIAGVIPTATESLFAAKGNPNNEIARFRALKLRNITITNQPTILKSTRDQALTRFTANYCDSSIQGSSGAKDGSRQASEHDADPCEPDEAADAPSALRRGPTDVNSGNCQGLSTVKSASGIDFKVENAPR